METTIIEKLDHSRYRIIMWFAIGWALFFGGFIIKEFIESRIIFGLILILGFFGWFLYLINLVKLIKLAKIVNSDMKLKEALNDELFKLNMHKSAGWGFGTVLITTTIFLLISTFSDISALLVSELILYIGILSFFISGLIYNRG